MRVGVIPENLVELLLTGLGVVPTPLLDTFQAIVRARVIMVATRLGVFETLKDQPRTASDVASHLGIDPRATEKLLNALVGAGYLCWSDSSYGLARVARKWVLKDSPQSLHDNLLLRFLEWEIVEKFEDFVRTGTPLNVHEELSPHKWEVYQRGMRSLAGLSAGEVARRLPVPAGARQMLDVGGSHGYYSVALCRRYPQLTSTILDLPQAVEYAQPILAREQMGERISFRAENVLEANLGDGQYDLVFISQLLHHFGESANRQLLARVAQSLRPGGVVAILEVIRPADPKRAGQTGALLDLFFAVTSLSGSWSLPEITSWQGQAGLVVHKPIHLRTIPGSAIQPASKP
jgi:2-polyprenyl-3-methyl-5-hydroxy-6-metoxy-1,4-benzoquinol methylase